MAYPIHGNIDTGDSPVGGIQAHHMRIRNHEETPLGVLLPGGIARGLDQYGCARVFIEAEEPGRGRLALNGEWWIVSGIDFGDGAVLNETRDSLLEKVEEGTLDEVGFDIDAVLLLKQRVVLVEVLGHGGRPGAEIAGEKTRAPAGPAEGFPAYA